jgi:dephospho-CoA kinase
VLKVGLTGGIATGKSYVRRRFELLGVPTIDADVLAREVLVPPSPALDAIVVRFGADVLDADGHLDRSRLGTIVFSDPEARRDLEAIIHPLVYDRIHRWFDKLREDGAARLALADIPLLYESGHAQDFERVVVTACSEAEQIRRLLRRDGIDLAQARQRIAAQWPLAEKVARADFVIDTNGSFDETNAQVEDVLRRLEAARPSSADL